MNHIAQVLNTKFKSPTQKEILSSESTKSPRIFHCGSWRSKMLVKVKECRDAIKNMITFDKLPNTIETAQRTIVNGASFSSNVSRHKKTSSLPDVITFSSVALKDEEYDNEENLTSNSTLNSNEKEVNTSAEVNDTVDRFTTSHDTTNNSLKSFLLLEKQVMEEYLDEKEAFTIKKKISAEPFLSYAEGAAEFVWADDKENNVPCRVWNSEEHVNCTDIDFENPHMNSTFSEYSEATKNRTSSPIQNWNPGFENHFSV